MVRDFTTDLAVSLQSLNVHSGHLLPTLQLLRLIRAGEPHVASRFFWDRIVGAWCKDLTFHVVLIMSDLQSKLVQIS